MNAAQVAREISNKIQNEHLQEVANSQFYISLIEQIHEEAKKGESYLIIPYSHNLQIVYEALLADGFKVTNPKLNPRIHTVRSVEISW